MLYQWKLEKKETYFKTDTLPFVIKNFLYLGDDLLWVNSKQYGQFTYNLASRKLEEKLKISVDELYRHQNHMILATNSNTIVFYDLITNRKGNYFMGHKEKITDINFHPNK